jgi:hypothetical protein
MKIKDRDIMNALPFNVHGVHLIDNTTNINVTALSYMDEVTLRGVAD